MWTIHVEPNGPAAEISPQAADWLYYLGYIRPLDGDPRVDRDGNAVTLPDISRHFKGTLHDVRLLAAVAARSGMHHAAQ